ncbi:MAG: hypothetical protein C4562_03675 [Actinobacteria bacterium]|nr:MAG: hypothetical protein C4562_03675 [Actinomycetota bacterium]
MFRSTKIAILAAVIVAITVSSCQAPKAKRQLKLNSIPVKAVSILRTVDSSNSTKRDRTEVAGLTKSFLEESYLNLDHSQGSVDDFLAPGFSEKYEGNLASVEAIVNKADSIKSAKANVSRLAVNYDSNSKPVLASAEFSLTVVYQSKDKDMVSLSKGSLALAKEEGSWKIIDININNKVN